MNNDIHDHDDFFDDVKQTQQKMAVLGFAFFIFSILFISTILYFFLAAAGILPPLDVVPFVPYV